MDLLFLPLGECSRELLSGLDDSGDGLAFPHRLSLSSLIPEDLEKNKLIRFFPVIPVFLVSPPLKNTIFRSKGGTRQLLFLRWDLLALLC